MTTSEDRELAIRAAWLSYVAGRNQADIAGQLGVSRVKVHRLIAQAHDQGLVKVRIEHELSELVELEERLRCRFALDVCIVVPSLGPAPHQGDHDPGLVALGTAGARLLERRLAAAQPLTVGLGAGRTLAAMIEQIRPADHARHRFVALNGSLTRHSSANPYDAIHRMVERTRSDGYYLPVPYIADTLDDKAVFTAQKLVQDVLALARCSDLCLVGIGQCSPDSFLKTHGLITDREFAELRAAGAVGDVISRFFDAEGRLVDSEVNQRSIGLELDDLRTLPV
ncbi:MAG: sugar-binding domain-containing protein, partial [Candidatus Competibacterales bacterium]|nr:sugar-binding domain-containing protein [Candidatus Competibacterales bacterium]